MNAAFKTDGKTTTQSALSSKSWGMSSGTSRISFNTLQLFLKRSSSFSWSAAEAEEERRGRTTSNMLMRYVIGFFMMGSPCAVSNDQIRLCYVFHLIAEKQKSATARPDWS